MTMLPKRLQKKLHERTEKNAFRALGMDDQLLDFSSNDYLGFARNEKLFSMTSQLLSKHGLTKNGSTGSRLISGNHKLYNLLETTLAGFHETESALVFNSGYDANIGFFSSVPQRGDLVFYDEYIHASIRDGIKMGNARNYKFKHNDVDDLISKITLSVLAQSRKVDTEIYIVTESVFSMDGDSPDLETLAEFCITKGYHLVVDEAHAVGIIGKHGEGLVQQLDLQNKIFARIITFGKAMGCHGAAILGTSLLKEYLVNFARSILYTTALSPHSVATILSSYEYLQQDGKAMQKGLLENIAFFKETIRQLKLEKHFIESFSAIQSCIVPTNHEVKKLSNHLADNGYNVKAILSPTVPEGQERLRFCLHSYNSKEEIGLVLEQLKKKMKV